MWILLNLAAAACGPDLETGLATLEEADAVSVDAIDEALGCHPSPLGSRDAARVHGLYARAWSDDTDRAAGHLMAAWEADPLYAPTLPAEHPAMVRLAQLQEDDPTLPIGSPAPFLQIDGQPSTWVRSEQPFLAQGPGRPAALVDSSRAFVPPPVEKKKGQGLLWGGVASGAVALGLYGGAWAYRDRYESLVATDGPNELRQSAHDATNALSIGAVVGAAAGAGLLTVHFVR